MIDPSNPARAYPLTWPGGWPRATVRVQANFHERAGDGSQRSLSLATALDRLELELGRAGAGGVIVSTNRERRVNGMISAAGAEPGDPGVAVYFRRRNRDIVLACDAWLRVADNVNAIAKHLEAIRGMDRWGVGSVDQVFTGYEALPAPTGCWQTLGIARTADRAAIDAAYRSRAAVDHPDKGGDRAAWDRLQAAYEAAKRERA